MGARDLCQYFNHPHKNVSKARRKRYHSTPEECSSIPKQVRDRLFASFRALRAGWRLFITGRYLVFVHKVESLSYNVQEQGLRSSEIQGVDFRQ